MAITAEQSIAQRQAEGDAQYRAVLAYVLGAGSQTDGAYEAELRVFRSVLALGRTLLRLFFEQRAAVRPVGPVTAADGPVLTYHDRRPVTYLSVFGKIVFRRHAFTAPGQAVVYPLDAELSLPERCYADLLREWSGFGSADGSFREVVAMLERILGWPLSVQALETTARERTWSTSRPSTSVPLRRRRPWRRRPPSWWRRPMGKACRWFSRHRRRGRRGEGRGLHRTDCVRRWSPRSTPSSRTHGRQRR